MKNLFSSAKSRVEGLLERIGITEVPDKKGEFIEGVVNSEGNIEVKGLLELIKINELPKTYYLELAKMAADGSDFVKSENNLSIIIKKLTNESANLSRIIERIKSLKNKDKKNEYLKETFDYLFDENKNPDFLKKTLNVLNEYTLQEARKATLTQPDWEGVRSTWQKVEEKFTGIDSKKSLFDQKESGFDKIEKSAFDAVEEPQFQDILKATGVNQKKNSQLLESAQKLIAGRNTRIDKLSKLQEEWLGINNDVGEKDKNYFNKILDDCSGEILRTKQLPIDFPPKKAADFIAVKKKWHKNEKRIVTILQWNAVKSGANEQEAKEYELLIHDHENGLAYDGTSISGGPLETIMKNVINPVENRLTIKKELASVKAELRKQVNLFKEKESSIQKLIRLENLEGFKNAPVIKLRLEQCKRYIDRNSSLIKDAENTIVKPDLNTIDGLQNRKNDVNSKIEEVKKLINKVDETLKYCTTISELSKTMDETHKKIIENGTATLETKNVRRESAPTTISSAPLDKVNVRVIVENTVQPVTSMVDTRNQILDDLENLIEETQKREIKYAAQVVCWGTKNTRKKEAVQKVLEFAETMKKKLIQHEKEIHIDQVTQARNNLKEKFNYFEKTTRTSSFDFFGTGNPTDNDKIYIVLAENFLKNSEEKLKTLIVSGATTGCRM